MEKWKGPQGESERRRKGEDNALNGCRRCSTHPPHTHSTRPANANANANANARKTCTSSVHIDTPEEIAPVYCLFILGLNIGALLRTAYARRTKGSMGPSGKQE
ncbi:hypothetical protein CALCODRAFT_246244 [Calocera cornea HHB12733]|uniref:Uncharacterized protein n=1 Tax=Calocera cornea HHB12733 TaxID=1353952 RepID=A0A165JUQ9_9BASI|nr:hypothetical protein CALCODRAFT_246244 [Calocera cornea HHB12733]